jgi:hypothetical protein
VPKKGAIDPIRLRKETREWLEEHTLRDVRGIARDLENAGEDVRELVDAINELDAVVNESTARMRRDAANAEAWPNREESLDAPVRSARTPRPILGEDYHFHASPVETLTGRGAHLGAVRVYRSLAFPLIVNDPALTWLLKEFRLLVNESIRIALQNHLQSRKRLTQVAYAELSRTHQVYKQYIPSAFEVALAVLKAYRRRVRKGLKATHPWVRRLFLKAENQSYSLDRSSGLLRRPLRDHEHVALEGVNLGKGLEHCVAGPTLDILNHGLNLQPLHDRGHLGGPMADHCHHLVDTGPPGGIDHASDHRLARNRMKYFGQVW